MHATAVAMQQEHPLLCKVASVVKLAFVLRENFHQVGIYMNYDFLQPQLF